LISIYTITITKHDYSVIVKVNEGMAGPDCGAKGGSTIKKRLFVVWRVKREVSRVIDIADDTNIVDKKHGRHHRET